MRCAEDIQYNLINDTQIIQWYIDDAYVGQSTYDAGANMCNGITVTGLSPNTVYSVLARPFYYGTNGSLMQDADVTDTFITGARPAYFAWSVPKTSGGKYYVGVDEWYSLMQNVSDVIYYKNGVTYNFQYPSTPEYMGIFTAARYNDLRAAIRSVAGYGYYIPEVAPGQTVTAYQLNIMVEELNAIP